MRDYTYEIKVGQTLIKINPAVKTSDGLRQVVNSILCTSLPFLK
jgi:hypothetical protein